MSIEPHLSRSEVLTDGYDLLIPAGKGEGVYRKADRQGRRTGMTIAHYVEDRRPVWPARRCSYVIATDGLTCPDCGTYDTFYAMTGERSYCGEQAPPCEECNGLGGHYEEYHASGDEPAGNYFVVCGACGDSGRAPVPSRHGPDTGLTAGA